MSDGSNEWAFLGGLWANESKNGVKYLSGSLGIGAKIMVWPVKEKRDGGPAFNVYIVPKGEKKDEGGQQNTANNAPDDSDIPFVWAIAVLGASLWPLL